MRRSGIKIMAELIGLIAPLIHIMILAIITGVLGFLCAIFITILGGYGIINFIDSNFNLKNIFILIFIIAILRGFFQIYRTDCCCLILG